MTNASDPILESRARVARWVSWGLRTGYGLYLGSLALFAIAMVTTFTGPLTAAMTACLIIGSIVLAPAIVFKYAVQAADRADRDGAW